YEQIIHTGDFIMLNIFLIIFFCDLFVKSCRCRRMMDGHKMEYFILCLSFIGWFILSCITLGIGFLWLIPYFYTTSAAFYEEIAEEYYEKNI
ncbi:DUF975 family protein, partial [Bacillus thuringiensis]|nr:DUF975 family protein [Bacillus thuringiensis]